MLLHGEKGHGMVGAGAGMVLQRDTEQAQNPRAAGLTKAAEGNRFLLEPPGGTSHANALERLELILTSDHQNRTVQDTRFALGHCRCGNCLQQTWGTNRYGTRNPGSGTRASFVGLVSKLAQSFPLLIMLAVTLCL